MRAVNYLGPCLQAWHKDSLPFSWHPAHSSLLFARSISLHKERLSEQLDPKFMPSSDAGMAGSAGHNRQRALNCCKTRPHL